MTEYASPKIISIRAREIKGNCSVYNLGDKRIINGPEINLKESDKECVHVLFALLKLIIELRVGLDPKSLGLEKEEHKKEYFCCLDPRQTYTNSGTVTFEVTQISSKK